MRAYARLGMLAVAVGVLMLLPTGDRSVQATDWCSGGVCQEWVARYDGPGSGDDSAVALVMDAAGNVYVTGYSEGSGTGYDYATVKYDANGSQLWAARYNGPANGEDRAADVALDALGNVYVTGYSQGSGTAHDYATAKYDANGNELWVARYNGPADDDDEATGLAVDTVGNVHVTGNSPSSSGSECATMKYSTSGYEMWVRRWSDDSCFAYALALDGSANIYVTGRSPFWSSQQWNPESFALKYNASGSLQWDQDIHHTILNRGYDIVVNDLGSVYITGGAGTSSWKSGFGTITFDSGGNELWHANEWAELAVWGGHSEAIALDASGNTYVTGLLSNYETHSDYVTVKYDATGTRLWDVRYITSANDSAQAIGLDADRNVYITGWVYGSGEDYGTIAYDTDGNELWTAFYNGPPGNADDLAYDLAVDQEGTVYVTGGSVGSGTGSDYATIKYVPDPDSDGIPGGSDNCPEVFNPFQENTDTTTDPPGDSYGDACDNCPAVANEGQVNSDADSYGDACDNCPLVGNEDQTNTDVALEAGGASVVGDSLGDQCDDDDDNDGFDDDVEAYLGTVGQDNCAGGFPGPGGDAWPLDINMDTFVTVVGDVLDYSGRIGAWGGPPPDANWMHRLDLNMDNYITVVGDVLRFAGNIGASCT